MLRNKKPGLVLELLMLVLIASGCQSPKTDFNVRLMDTEQNRPGANLTILFFGETGPMGMDEIEVKVPLDANGESRVRLQKLRWRATIEGKGFGMTFRASDLQSGGTFRFYDSPPSPYDTNLYPSKYVLEIHRP
jgi:hypothetical protein